MEQILHHLLSIKPYKKYDTVEETNPALPVTESIKPYKKWDILHIN